MSSPTPLKVVGVGLNKTGTTTLGACLKHIGYHHTTYDLEAFRHYAAGDIEQVFEMAEPYDSYEDWPWLLLYKEFDERYPDAKFILTTRKDADTWFKSVCKHADRYGFDEMQSAIYGSDVPHTRREELIATYESHNDQVRTYFKGRPEKLLEVCWEQGDEWGSLSKFLSFPVPQEPFPHMNKSPNAVERYIRKKGNKKVVYITGLVKRKWKELRKV